MPENVQVHRTRGNDAFCFSKSNRDAADRTAPRAGTRSDQRRLLLLERDAADRTGPRIRPGTYVVARSRGPSPGRSGVGRHTTNRHTGPTAHGPVSDDRRPKCLSPTYLLRIWFYCLPLAVAAAGLQGCGRKELIGCACSQGLSSIQRAARERATYSVDALEARHWPIFLAICIGAVAP